MEWWNAIIGLATDIEVMSHSLRRLAVGEDFGERGG
jgi:hypothetical protein